MLNKIDAKADKQVILNGNSTDFNFVLENKDKVSVSSLKVGSYPVEFTTIDR